MSWLLSEMVMTFFDFLNQILLAIKLGSAENQKINFISKRSQKAMKSGLHDCIATGSYLRSLS